MPINDDAVIKAYGLLWLFHGDSNDPNIRLAHQARHLLRDTMTPGQLKRGIALAKEHTRDWRLKVSAHGNTD
jgi:hypothetical protein